MSTSPKKPYYLHCPKCGWRDNTQHTDLSTSQAKPIHGSEHMITGFACPKCDTPLQPKEENLLDKIKSLF